VLSCSGSVFSISDSTIVAKISGDKVWEKFRLESGIHRVQRTPPTESKGRRHTSTIAVAVLPFRTLEETEYPESEFKIECVCGQGPGGQHRNRNMTAVKITHLPTKVNAYADGRSQHSNKQSAMAVLLGRLREKDVGRYKERMNQERSEQFDGLGRGTRTRTYNFIRNKVIDERAKKKFPIREIMDGKLDLIYDSMETE